MPRLLPSLPRALTRSVLGALLLLAAAGCTGTRPELADEPATTTGGDSQTSTTVAMPPSEVASTSSPAIDVFADATSEAPVRQITAEEATSAPGVPIVFLVRSQTDDRAEVYLPVPPNGSTGWVRKSDVNISTVPFRIRISLAEHSIRVLDGDDVVLDEAVGIGASDRPAVQEQYFIRELLQPPDPTGPYGAYVYGLSGLPIDLNSFNTGQGLVGIHGTTDPTLVGADTPTGSIRLTNEVITRLVTDVGLPLGTPIEIFP